MICLKNKYLFILPLRYSKMQQYTYKCDDIHKALPRCYEIAWVVLYLSMGKALHTVHSDSQKASSTAGACCLPRAINSPKVLEREFDPLPCLNYHFFLQLACCCQQLQPTSKHPAWVIMLAHPTLISCVWAPSLPQELCHWFCNQNLLLSPGIAFWSDCQMTGRGSKFDLNLNSAAWPSSCNCLYFLLNPYTLCVESKFFFSLLKQSGGFWLNLHWKTLTLGHSFFCVWADHLRSVSSPFPIPAALVPAPNLPVSWCNLQLSHFE